jgi:hypothetical protein
VVAATRPASVLDRATQTSATAAARTTAGPLPYGLGLPGYPMCTGVLTTTVESSLLSPARFSRQPPPGFPTNRQPVADVTWAPTAPSTDSALVSVLATIQAVVAASLERQRAASLAWEQERAMGHALTTQLANVQRLLLGRDPSPPPVAPSPALPESPHASGLDGDTIAALHAQAAGVHNIRSFVSVLLDPASSHYTRWRGQVLLTLRRFALADHVLDDLITPPSPSWAQMDTVVLSWLHGTITVELQDIIRDQADTARQAWLALEDQFLGNRDARALHLDAQFHLFSQGDLSVDEYCRQMKGMADSLRDLGEPVADRTLVLNLLRGLSPRYGHLKDLIKRIVPFPTFQAARNELLLEELTMASETPAPALYCAPRGARPLASRRPGPLPAPHLSSPRPLVRRPPPMKVVAPARAAVGVAAPHVVVPPAGVAARRGHLSTIPGPRPSPCGRARPRMPLAPRRRPSLLRLPMACLRRLHMACPLHLRLHPNSCPRGTPP